MTKNLNKKFLFFLLIFISVILIFAYVIEYQLGYKPCKLCIYERIPYFASIPLLIKILFSKKGEKFILIILSLIFFISTVLAFYHFGIEQGFFEESLTCTSGSLQNALSKEQILEQLNQNTISCKDVSFEIFGISLATINTIFSFLLSVIFIKLVFNYGKN